MDKILVIDDSAVQAEFLRSILRDDYDVSICHTAKEGILAAKEGSFSQGKGTVIGIGPNITRWMSDRFIAKAKAREIPWAPEVMTGHSGTNAWRVQTAREGIATAVLSLPLKYMHSPVETLDWADLESTATLLAAFVQDLEKEGGVHLVD